MPYFWSDQYDMKIQAYGYLRDHDEAVIVDGDLASRPLHRRLPHRRPPDRRPAVGMPPKALRPWRALIAAGSAWNAGVMA